jgi:hypothetical protein
MQCVKKFLPFIGGSLAKTPNSVITTEKLRNTTETFGVCVVYWYYMSIKVFRPIDKKYAIFRKTGLPRCAGKPLRPEINRKVWREGTGSYRISWRVRTYRPVLSHALFIRKVQVWL